tara:strand:- start:1719 stop:2738 length:1020 start_codon:yes stop_codon:yes gene_type:complete
MLNKKKRPLIIAEAGVNHNGKLINAFKLINAAKKAGADYIKFQIYKTENLVDKKIGLANYQQKNLKKKISQYNMLKKYSLGFDKFLKIIKYCNKKKIKFIATPFDLDSLKFLKKNKVDFIKISSSDLNNFEILSEVIKYNTDLILSSGLSNLKEIKETLSFLYKKNFKKKQLTLLHCTSNYPTPLNDANLNVIISLRKKLKINIGYSDHTRSLLTGAIAISLGANIIEKHITLSNTMPGPDHKASLNPKDFKSYIDNINQVKKLLGSYKKKLNKSEISTKKIVSRYIVAKKFIKKGEVFTKNNITCKRTSYGISPNKWLKILGKKSKKNFITDERISLN